MKSVLLNVLVVVMTAIISSIGFTAIIIAFHTKDGEYHIFIPAMILSWIVFFPLYSYWSDLFKRIFKLDKDAY